MITFDSRFAKFGFAWGKPKRVTDNARERPPLTSEVATTYDSAMAGGATASAAALP